MTQTLAIGGPRARGLVAFFAAAVLALSSIPAVEALGRLVPVIVMSRDAGTAADLTRSAGGEVRDMLPIVDGVSARVPSSRIPGLSQRAIVVPDRAMRLTSDDFSGDLATAYPAEVGAPQMWSQGVDGSGTTVALIDTGVADVADLRDHVVAEANFSREPGYADTYGHGTFQAGLMAGDGSSSGGRYRGVAPGASLVSIKVADSAGETSLAQVLAGVQLLDVSRERFGVRVALLAMSTGSPLPPALDPLSLALRTLWAHGIVVVVPAGNEGPDELTITSPGDDPVLLTAASVNDQATNDVVDDVPSDFSSRGPTRWGDEKPDVAAPGEHLTSVRAPGSTIDRENPSAVVEGSYFKGSGTSMSAAVTAGAAALVVAAHPGYSPDAVKAVLMGAAHPVPAGDAASVGAGVVDAAEASALDVSGLDLPPVPEVDEIGVLSGKRKDWLWHQDSDGVWRWVARSWASRSWASRTWDSRSWDELHAAARSWAARSWEARSWESRSWASRSWASRTWAARSWAARTWSSRSWASRSWASRSWAHAQWDSRTWQSRTWSSRSWSSRTWSSRTWSDVEWSSRTWSSRSWSSRTWSSGAWT